MAEKKGKGKKKKVDFSLGTEMALYNSGLAFVRETSIVGTEDGTTRMKLEMPDSVDIGSIWCESPTLQILEQQYSPAGHTSRAMLLEESVGKDIEAWTKIGDETRKVAGKLLKIEGGSLLIKSGGAVEYVNPIHVRMPYVDLDTDAELGLVVKSKGKTDHTLRKNYLSGGFGWNADYVMVVRGDEAGIKCQATIHNDTEKSFGGTKLTLVAGDVRRDRYNEYRDGALRSNQFDGKTFRGITGEGVEELAQIGDVGEFHTYKLKDAVDIEAKGTKKVTLFDGEASLLRRYEFNGAAVTTIYKIKNSEENGLGDPMPGGKIRVYEEDDSGSLCFVGEHYNGHVAKDETVKMTLGEAFDLKGEKTEKDYKVTRDPMDENIEYHDRTFEVKLKNHKSEDVTIDVYENAYGNWSLLDPSETIAEKTSSMVRWEIKVPSNSKQTLTYTIRQKVERPPKPLAH